jgi:hypothetical protein
MIQYPDALKNLRNGGDYWIPAFAGMTSEFNLSAEQPRKGRGT